MAFNYSPRIVRENLIIHLDAANRKSYSGSGTTWFDLTGRNNNGTLTNGPTYSSSNGGNIVTDSTNDYITTPYTSNTFNNQTQSVWYRWNGVNQARTLTYFGNSGLDGLGFLLHNGTSGVAGNRIGIYYGGSVFNALSTSVALISNVWCNLTLTRTDTTSALYSNGVFIASTSTSPLTAASYDFGWGDEIAGAGGNVAVICFYNRALNANEVLQNYNALKSRFNLG
jgi:hypothetical protein